MKHYPVRTIADANSSQFEADIHMLLRMMEFENAMEGHRVGTELLQQWIKWIPDSQSKIIRMIDEELAK